MLWVENITQVKFPLQVWWPDVSVSSSSGTARSNTGLKETEEKDIWSSADHYWACAAGPQASAPEPSDSFRTSRMKTFWCNMDEFWSGSWFSCVCDDEGETRTNDRETKDHQLIDQLFTAQHGAAMKVQSARTRTLTGMLFWVTDSQPVQSFIRLYW